MEILKEMAFDYKDFALQYDTRNPLRAVQIQSTAGYSHDLQSFDDFYVHYNEGEPTLDNEGDALSVSPSREKEKAHQIAADDANEAASNSDSSMISARVMMRARGYLNATMNSKMAKKRIVKLRVTVSKKFRRSTSLKDVLSIIRPYIMNNHPLQTQRALTNKAIRRVVDCDEGNISDRVVFVLGEQTSSFKHIQNGNFLRDRFELESQSEPVIDSVWQRLTKSKCFIRAYLRPSTVTVEIVDVIRSFLLDTNPYGFVSNIQEARRWISEGECAWKRLSTKTENVQKWTVTSKALYIGFLMLDYQGSSPRIRNDRFVPVFSVRKEWDVVDGCPYSTTSLKRTGWRRRDLSQSATRYLYGLSSMRSDSTSPRQMFIEVYTHSAVQRLLLDKVPNTDAPRPRVQSRKWRGEVRGSFILFPPLFPVDIHRYDGWWTGKVIGIGRYGNVQVAVDGLSPDYHMNVPCYGRDIAPFLSQTKYRFDPRGNHKYHQKWTTSIKYNTVHTVDQKFTRSVLLCNEIKISRQLVFVYDVYADSVTDSEFRRWNIYEKVVGSETFLNAYFYSVDLGHSRIIAEDVTNLVFLYLLGTRRMEDIDLFTEGTTRCTTNYKEARDWLCRSGFDRWEDKEWKWTSDECMGCASDRLYVGFSMADKGAKCRRIRNIDFLPILYIEKVIVRQKCQCVKCK